MIDRSSKAFISYVRENRLEVDRLVGELRLSGIKVWIDREDILPGEDWKSAINIAINDGAFFIACFSKEFEERKETYMHEELLLAFNKLRSMKKDHVWFIPVLINKANIPTYNINDQKTLDDINVIALFDDWKAGIKNILQTIKLEDPIHRRCLHLVDLIRYFPEEREYAIKQLASIGNDAIYSVPALKQILQNAEWKDRKIVLQALPTVGIPILSAITEALYDDDPTIRKVAADALRKIGPDAIDAIPILKYRICDPEWDVRWSAARAMVEIYPKNTDTIPVFIEALKKMIKRNIILQSKLLEKWVL